MTERVAADVFRVVEVERQLRAPARAWLWVRTVAAGLAGAETSAPAISDVVFFRGDVELRRLEVSGVAELEAVIGGILLELETSTPEQFAASWELPAPRSPGAAS